MPAPRKRTPEDSPRRESPLLERKRQLVREALRRAAEDLISANGYEATTVEAITTAAGVSRRTFFRYYDSKEQVIVEGADRLGDDLLEAIAQRPRREAPLVSVQLALVTVLERSLARPDLVRHLIGIIRKAGALRRAMQERRSRMEERLAALFAARLRLNPRRDCDPVILALLTRAMLDAAFTVWFDQHRKDVPGMIDELFESLRTLAAPPRPRR